MDAQPTTAARNPRKRSRASRRAPTTVLTTDTSNFRAMVQEFTGIPSTPFSSSSSNIISTAAFAGGRSSRLDDLFRSTAVVDHLRRPFPQKFTNLVNNSSEHNIHFPTQASDPYSNPFLSSLLQTATTKFTIPPSTDIHRLMGGMDGLDHALDSGHGGKFVTKAGAAHDGDDDVARPTKIAKYINGDSLSGADGEEGFENTARSEEGAAAIESWICSTDY